ncbi:MAG: 2,3-bisphosphoglycerate-independent phosphoglycerate mutase [Anaerolineae bacterium]
MILDGWGLRTRRAGNAVALAETPNYDRWLAELERTVVDASEEFVGLIEGQMGNSEVGHLNLGAGRIVFQDISRINNAIKDSSFYDKDPLHAAVNHLGDGNHLHMIGLLGPGGVHALDEHLFALLRFAKSHDITPVLHVITDGRDTAPDSGIEFLTTLQETVAAESLNMTIATVSGRYYTMDRDKRWDRTAKAYNAMVYREGNAAETAESAVRQSYQQEVFDEFIVPTVIGDDDALAIQPGDSLIFFNFRADRMRQIVRMFTHDDFEDRPDVGFVENLHIATMTEYADDLPTDVLFPMEIVDKPLAEVLADHGLTQFHIAETEKYPHVTYFFNGRQEEPFEGESREIIPSPKVATYDLQPEMSAPAVTETILKRIAEHDDDFLLINFANPDMVGHTGDLQAARKAVETVDACASRVVQAIVDRGGVAIVTADHGNCETMINPATGKPHTYHTTNPVALFVIGTDLFTLKSRGKLADVAPTILDLLGIDKPSQMTGNSLLKHD